MNNVKSTTTQIKTAPTSSRAEDRAPPSPAPQPQSEDLSGGSHVIRSMNYMESFSFLVEGAIYPEYMPRIAKSDDGLVPVLPCLDMETEEHCLFIMPGLFQSWMRRNRPPIGTKLRLDRKGKDPETGAWKLTVTRL